MKRLFLYAAFAFIAVIALPGASLAGDGAAPSASSGGDSAGFTNVTSHKGAETQESPASSGASLTEMLRDYKPKEKPDETQGKPDDVNKLFDVKTDKSIKYDEKDIYRHDSKAGYQRQKEDFADPKKVMN